jgi:hypothetical protein
MKIKSTVTTLELSKPLEKLRSSYTEDKYFIERLEDDKKIVWYGLETNWIFHKATNAWYDDKNNPIDIPEYETIFLNIS